MNKTLRISLIIIVSLIILVFIAGLIAPVFLEDQYETKLLEQFNTQTENKYQAELELDIGIWSRSVTADSILITPDSSNNNPFVKQFAVHSIEVDGISWLSLLSQTIPDIHSITVHNPEVELYSREFSSSSLSEFMDSNKPSGDTSQTDYPLFDFHIVDAAFKIVYPKGGEESSLETFNLDAQQVNLNAILQDTAASYMEELDISAENFIYSLEDKLYRFTVDEFNINKKEQLATVKNLAFRPILPKYEFSERRGYQLDRLDVKVGELEFKGFELDSLPSGNMNLDTLIVREGWLEVFRDKHKEKAPGFSPKPLVNDMANNVDFPFSLDVALIANSTIIYEEHVPPAEEAGHISFDSLDAVLRNFNTASHPDFPNDTLSLYVETRFMDASQLTVDIKYPVFREDDTHFIKAHLNPIDPQEVAGMLEFVAFMRVESGMVNELSAEMELNDTSSTGQLKILYEDLEVAILNKEDPNKDGIREQVADFITNNFVIISNNTAEEPRIGEISYELEEGKSIFAYWWRSLLSGIQNSIR